MVLYEVQSALIKIRVKEKAEFIEVEKAKCVAVPNLQYTCMLTR